MNAIVKAMDEAFSGGTSASDEKLRAHCLEQLDHCQRLLCQLKRPEFRRYVQFAIMWRDMERKLEEIRRVLDEHSGEMAAGPFDELFQQLTAKN